MEITQEMLRKIVIKAIEDIQSKSSKNKYIIDKEKLYVFCNCKWNSIYWNFFEVLQYESQYEIIPVVYDDSDNEFFINNLRKFKFISKIIHKDEIELLSEGEYIIVFPVVSRNLVVKTALCLEDDFSTQQIFSALENGNRVLFYKKGFKKFTGKESRPYVKKILNYYKTLLEFNIEICDEITEKKILVQDEVALEKFNYSDSNELEGKRIITANEIGRYVNDNTITLNKGDIITELAIEKAEKMNISILYA
ncbi:MAG: hypothetical protein Q4F66_02125 [Clostridium sp.]|nr:hypothetical protein [Clostridium sp.]